MVSDWLCRCGAKGRDPRSSLSYLGAVLGHEEIYASCGLESNRILWRNFADRSYGLFLFWNAGGIEKAKCEHQS